MFNVQKGEAGPRWYSVWATLLRTWVFSLKDRKVLNRRDIICCVCVCVCVGGRSLWLQQRELGRYHCHGNRVDDCGGWEMGR